jgi:hypothetical protein
MWGERLEGARSRQPLNGAAQVLCYGGCEDLMDSVCGALRVCWVLGALKTLAIILTRV